MSEDTVITPAREQLDPAVREFLAWDRRDSSSASWVSPRYRCFYVGLGKTASTRVKLTLHLLEGHQILERPFPWLHARATLGESFVPTLDDLPVGDATDVLTSPDWFRFSFVRNPYDRLFAAYKAFIMRDASPPSPFYRRIVQDIRTRHGYAERTDRPDAVVCFRDFVQYVQETLPVREDYHWCRMTWGLRPDLVAYDVVGHFESFDEDFGQILRRLGVDEDLIPGLLEPENQGPSGKLPLAAVYDWELAEQVYEMYRDDFTTYGYEKDSWLDDRLRAETC